MQCPICLRTVARLVKDHCHDSGLHRGLICASCNSGLGFFYDNAAAMKRAIKYLAAFNQRHQVVGINHEAETLAWLKRQHAKRFS